LLISCPCALVISTPVAVFSAIGVANRKGAIVKGGKYIEEMGRLKAVALDKTRTLTRGELIVSDIVPFNGYSESDVIACAAGMEAFSEHPIARSIIARAESMQLKPHEIASFTSEPGKGLRGVCKECCDTRTCLGNLRFVAEEHQIGEDVRKKVDELESQGKTVIVTCDGTNIKGVIALTDEIRPESRQLIAGLRRIGITPVMLTGDNKASAEFVAKELGITDVRAGLLPDGKVKEISRLVEEHRHVAMVGDGVNDAPALASASVGIAMGAIGSDIAIENADIALMTNNLGLILYLVNLGKKCLVKIQFNIVFAVMAKLIFLGLAITGKSNLALAIFADVGVTVLVILNSLELYRYSRKAV
jgi:Zn2+/Cd2+-exporting ATPase